MKLHVVTLKPDRTLSEVAFPTCRDIRHYTDVVTLTRIRNQIVGLTILQLCASALTWLLD